MGVVCSYPWDECVPWARNVGKEFAQQVAKEKAAKMEVSAFMDVKTDVELAKLQVGFVSFLIKPFFGKLHRGILSHFEMRVACMGEDDVVPSSVWFRNISQRRHHRRRRRRPSFHTAYTPPYENLLGRIY